MLVVVFICTALVTAGFTVLAPPGLRWAVGCAFLYMELFMIEAIRVGYLVSPFILLPLG